MQWFVQIRQHRRAPERQCYRTASFRPSPVAGEKAFAGRWQLYRDGGRRIELQAQSNGWPTPSTWKLTTAKATQTISQEISNMQAGASAVGEIEENLSHITSAFSKVANASEQVKGNVEALVA